MPLPCLRWPLAAALLFLGGCGQESLLEKFASEEDRRIATQCIDLLRAGKLEEIEARLEPSLRNETTRAVLAQLYEILPRGEPTSIKLVGAQLNTGTQGRDSNLTYEYAYDARYFLVNCATRTTDSARYILDLGVHSLPGPVDEQSRLDLAGKTPLHYGMLLAVIVAPLLSVVALIRCVREQGLRRKWLWVLFIAFGIGQFALYWNTGAWTFRPVHVQLFSAGTTADVFNGRVLQVALPLGAIVYLVRRLRNPGTARRSKTA